MKKFKLNVQQINTGEYIILANSAAEAEEKFIAIHNTTDMVDFQDSELIITADEVESKPVFEELCKCDCDMCNHVKRVCCSSVIKKFNDMSCGFIGEGYMVQEKLLNT